MLLPTTDYLTFKSHVKQAIEWIIAPGKYIIRWIKEYWRDYRLLSIAAQYSKKMIELEKVALDTSSKTEVQDFFKKVRELNEGMKVSAREKVVKSQVNLRRLFVGLAARLGEERDFNQEAYDQLCVHAREWKATKCYFINKDLTPRDQEKLKEACRYNSFNQLLLDDADWRGEFFKWTILNDSKVCPFQPNQVPVFVKFPGLYKEILRKIAYRGSRVGGEIFQVDDEKQLLKIAVENQYVAIKSDAPPLVLKGHYGIGKMTLTFQQIFKELKGKISYDGEGKLEITDKGGIWLYDAKKLGYWHEDERKYHSFELDDPELLARFPTPDQDLTFEEIEKRYGFKITLPSYLEKADLSEIKFAGCPKGIFPICVLAATQKEEKQALGTHSFYEFLLVDFATKKVRISSIGQFLYPFPFGVLETLLKLPKYNQSTMYSPDENIFNADRQHAGDYEVPPVAIVPTSEREWGDFFQSIIKDISRGWEGKLPFNFVVGQCTTRLWKKATRHFGKGRIPDLRLPVWSLVPKGGEGKFFRYLKDVPFRDQMMTGALLALGSWKKMRVAKKHGPDRWISLFRSETPFNSPKNWIIHPGGFFKKQTLNPIQQ